MFEYRDKQLMAKIIKMLRKSNLGLRFMHVCGTHQDTIVKYGLDRIFKECSIEVRQGPGCPVCITTDPEIEKGIILGAILLVIGLIISTWAAIDIINFILRVVRNEDHNYKFTRKIS